MICQRAGVIIVLTVVSMVLLEHFNQTWLLLMLLSSKSNQNNFPSTQVMLPDKFPLYISSPCGTPPTRSPFTLGSSETIVAQHLVQGHNLLIPSGLKPATSTSILYHLWILAVEKYSKYETLVEFYCFTMYATCRYFIIMLYHICHVLSQIWLEP